MFYIGPGPPARSNVGRAGTGEHRVPFVLFEVMRHAPISLNSKQTLPVLYTHLRVENRFKLLSFVFPVNQAQRTGKKKKHREKEKKCSDISKFKIYKGVEDFGTMEA